MRVRRPDGLAQISARHFLDLYLEYCELETKVQESRSGENLTMSTARLEYNGQSWELPVVEGTEKELGIDISDLRAKSGMITLDEGYANTGSCQSAITYIDGDKGILRYRGYPIEQLAEQSNFVETAWLVIGGKLPNEQERARFSALLTKHEMIHESMRNHFEGFPNNAPPMAILSVLL